MAKDVAKNLKTAGKVILGLACVILGILAMINWKWHLLAMIKGCIGPFLVLVGAIVIAIARE